jgi:hypothetical protein
MFIWRGRGGLVVLITFVMCLLANLVADLFGGKGYWDNNRWVLGCALVLSAGLIFLVHATTDHTARRLVDAETGQQYVFAPTHDLFWIPIKYWAFIVGCIGVAVVFSTLLSV